MIRMDMTEEQALIVERACEMYSRTILGQTEGIEDALHAMTRISDRSLLDLFRETFRVVFFPGLSRHESIGIGHDENADNAYAIHRALRYNRYLRMSWDDQELMRHTVMSDPPTKLGCSDAPPKVETIPLVAENNTSEKA